MSRIREVMAAFFEDDDWHFEAVPNRDSLLRLYFEGRRARWICYAEAREDQNQFLFYSMLPIRVPSEKRIAVAEFVTRANYGMVIGNFEMDFDDGEVRYKTSIDVGGLPFEPPMCRPLVHANVLTTDRYFSGIMEVVYGDVSPALAVARVEADGERGPEPAEA